MNSNHEPHAPRGNDVIYEILRIADKYKHQNQIADFYGADLKFIVFYYSLSKEQFVSLREAIYEHESPYYSVMKNEQSQEKRKWTGLGKTCLGGIYFKNDKFVKYVGISYFKHPLTRYHVRVELHLEREFNEYRSIKNFILQYQDTIVLSRHVSSIESLHDAFFATRTESVLEVAPDFDFYILNRVIRIAFQEMMSSVLALPNRYLHPVMFGYDTSFSQQDLLARRKSGKYMGFTGKWEDGVMILNFAAGELIEGSVLDTYVRDLRGEIENSEILNPESRIGLPFFVAMSQRIEEADSYIVIKNPFTLQRNIQRKLEYDYLSSCIKNARELNNSSDTHKGLATRLYEVCDSIRAMNDNCLNLMSNYIQLVIAIGLSFTAIVVALVVR